MHACMTGMVRHEREMILAQDMKCGSGTIFFPVLPTLPVHTTSSSHSLTTLIFLFFAIPHTRTALLFVGLVKLQFGLHFG